MRILLVLICFLQVATASEIKLEDGRTVSGSLAVFNAQGAKIINHGATPDEFYTWAEISAVGLGSHEQTLRNQFLKQTDNTDSASPRSTTPGDQSVNLTEIFSQPRSADANTINTEAPARTEAPASPSAAQPGTSTSPPTTQRAPQKPVPSSYASPLTLNGVMKRLDSLKQHPLQIVERNFGLLVVGLYLGLVLVAFLGNFTSKKTLVWTEKPESIKKAVDTAFWTTCVLAIATFVGLQFFPDKIGMKALPLWQAGSSLGVLIILALGLRSKNRAIAILLLILTVGGSSMAFYGIRLSDVTFLKSTSLLMACFFSLVLIDALFAVFHYRAKIKEPAINKPLPQMDTADAAA